MRAYRTDLDGFVEWCGRLGLDGPAQVDRRTLRRYLAFLSSRSLARAVGGPQGHRRCGATSAG